jgi:hypothetical protein
VSVRLGFQLPKEVAKVKYFFFDTKDRRGIERGIGGTYIADTTEVTITLDPSARATFKEYTFTTKLANKARVRVYITNEYPVTVYVNLNGTDVASVTVTTTNTAPTLVMDEYIDVPQNTKITLKIDIKNGSTTESKTATVSKCYVIVGYALTSTTPVDILTVTLDPQNDTYKLDVRGNFVYRVGVRWWVKGNRKTTATASITGDLPNTIYGVNNLGANDDGDSEVILRIGTGDLASSFTIRGNVGADGDIIIITGVYCQVTLRRNITDSYNLYIWNVLIRERGLLLLNGRAVSITANVTSIEVNAITLSGRAKVLASSTGTDVIYNSPPVAVIDAPEYGVLVLGGADTGGEAMLLFLNIVVIGE